MESIGPAMLCLPRDLALSVDLYALTMLEVYLREGLTDTAVFSLFVRRLPPRRNFLLGCGLADALEALEALSFSDESIAYLKSLRLFSEPLLEWLCAFRFQGDVFAIPEGTCVFAEEPLLEVVAPLPQAQLLETLLLNQLQLPTATASKAARQVLAADHRSLVDFGMRRAHGLDAALKIARAAYVAGFQGTSSVLAAQRHGIPAVGTMAHSFVLAHEDELSAFRAFARAYPEATLLVDTYDTLEGVRNVIRLAKELGKDFRVRAIRLDSGDLVALSREARRLLDGAGLNQVAISASGGIDEEEILRCAETRAPISGFGVGTSLAVSQDAPSLDMVYKLVAYAGRAEMKLSTDKVTVPMQKQVFRVGRNGRTERDVIACHDEALEGRPLLTQVMSRGRRLTTPDSLDRLRERARGELAALPQEIRSLETPPQPFPVELSAKLAALKEKVTAEISPPNPGGSGGVAR